MRKNNNSSEHALPASSDKGEKLMLVGKDYINIPIELIKYAVMHKTINQLKVFIGLKDLTSGQFILNSDSIKQFSKRIEVTPMTFKKHINWLSEHKWVVVNSKQGRYRAISFHQLSRKYKYSSRTGALFFTKEYRKFRGFSYAAIITFYMKYLKRSNNKKYWENAEPMRKQGRTKMSSAPNIFYLPHSYLANVLKTSKSNAVKYRLAAISNGYLKVRKSYIRSDLKIEQVDVFKKYIDEPNKIVRRHNKVYVQQADILSSTITLRTKKNLPVLRKKRHLIRRE